MNYTTGTDIRDRTVGLVIGDMAFDSSGVYVGKLRPIDSMRVKKLMPTSEYPKHAAEDTQK